MKAVHAKNLATAAKPLFILNELVYPEIIRAAQQGKMSLTYNFDGYPVVVIESVQLMLRSDGYKLSSWAQVHCTISWDSPFEEPK